MWNPDTGVVSGNSSWILASRGDLGIFPVPRRDSGRTAITRLLPPTATAAGTVRP
jgi:hypothetical protein